MSYIPLSWRITIGLVLAICLCAGSAWFGWHMRSLKADAALQQAAMQANAALSAAIKDRDALDLQLQAANDTIQAQHEKVRHENQTLHSAVIAGTVGLRVNGANCSASVPKASASSGVDTGTSATLDAAAQSDYFALLDAINDTESKLSACQAQLRIRGK